MSIQNATYDVIILGGGAAGLMCAIEIGKRGRSVLVIEHEEALGKKITISGGGRCNFTNLLSSPANFISENPHFCRSALSRYTPQDFLRLIDKHRIAYHERNKGQLFCNGSARQIVEMLQREGEAVGVQMRLKCKITDVQRSDEFKVETTQGRFASQALVVATGGLSIPKIGATDLGYRLAKQFGLKTIPPRPGLTPLLFHSDDRERFGALSGVSLEAEVHLNKIAFRESVLFTHRGLSGPAILQISSYWNAGELIIINLLPDLDVASLLSREQQTRTLLVNILAEFLPRRFAQIWCDAYFPSKSMNQYSSKELRCIASKLHNWEITPEGTEGFGKAEVTLGGVDTGELSSKTMESKKIPGLFFIGEVVDVTGHLGGHNFQWAWASGFAAGQYA